MYSSFLHSQALLTEEQGDTANYPLNEPTPTIDTSSTGKGKGKAAKQSTPKQTTTPEVSTSQDHIMLSLLCKSLTGWKG